ncbi:hypothetical protein AMS68_002680 [Peltaster fructicola]|uniref:Uncharacterized protein n=1 Tax=Peltaster fructicola TaxID=286661 RepID=A0A6H0XR37_9PEZI|nr:hypothetical protein AMS68_002680 [Peltaster fructicola]
MYTSTILASAAILAGSALASTPGKAIIVNACNYPVYLGAVPSADGGYSESDATLAHGDSWNQTWTQLTNGNGWSLKLSKSSDLSHPLQYEYTYHADESVIWFDLSCVDGNPWDGNWEVTSSGNSACTPKQSFYRYATDDAFGMQDCPHDSDITVTLCSGEDQAESIISSIVSAVAPATTATSTTPVAATTTHTVAATTPTVTALQNTWTQHAAATQTTGSGFDGSKYFGGAVQEKVAVNPTTLATVTTPAAAATVNAAVVDADGDIVTVVETVVETAIAYETYVPGKRHVHHPEHPHFR